MPSSPQRSNPYPLSPDSVRGSQFEAAYRLYGTGASDSLFKGAPKTVTPWSSAGRTKANPLGYDRERVHAALANPSDHIADLDPRHLHATQGWVTQEGVEYYMGNQYRETGQTFKDMGQAGNRFPVVYTDAQGVNKIVSGHHRATAALLRGEQLRAIHVKE